MSLSKNPTLATIVALVCLGALLAPTAGAMPARPVPVDEKGQPVAAGSGALLPPGVEIAPGIDAPTGGPGLRWTGTANLPVLLVQFPGIPGQQTSTAFFNILFPIGTYPTGTMNDYIREQGLLSLWGQVDAWRTVSHFESYYVNGFGGMLNSYPMNSQGLVQEAHCQR